MARTTLKQYGAAAMCCASHTRTRRSNIHRINPRSQGEAQLTQLERADLFARIARLRRLMPRNGEVMALCDVTERLVTNSPVTPVTSVMVRFLRRHGCSQGQALTL